MSIGLLGKKLGMTRVYDAKGPRERYMLGEYENRVIRPNAMGKLRAYAAAVVNCRINAPTCFVWSTPHPMSKYCSPMADSSGMWTWHCDK